MKFLCRACCLVAVLLATHVARAASSEDDDAATFGDYAPTTDDDLIQYIPKYSLRLGFRSISGAKTGFSGRGSMISSTLIGDTTTPNATRVYHDGYVTTDQRSVSDATGNASPVAGSDGKTDAWKIDAQSQIDERNGFAAFHAYDVTTADSSSHQKDPGSSFGVELSINRAMGKLFHSKVEWGLIAGMSVNQFNSHSVALLDANLVTTTDYYSLFGQRPNTVPYTAPEVSGVGDTSILIANKPVRMVTGPTLSTGTVSTDWTLRGAYMTFRAGPTVSIPIGAKFVATLSAGAVLVYAGSDYTIGQSFVPQTGDTMTETNSDGASSLMPGFYFDADLQYSINETAGLYLGGVYQNSGSYSQTVSSPDGQSVYKSRIDLSSLQGFRAGVSFKF